MFLTDLSSQPFRLSPSVASSHVSQVLAKVTMYPDRDSNPDLLSHESGALSIELPGLDT